VGTGLGTSSPGKVPPAGSQAMLMDTYREEDYFTGVKKAVKFQRRWQWGGAKKVGWKRNMDAGG